MKAKKIYLLSLIIIIMASFTSGCSKQGGASKMRIGKYTYSYDSRGSTRECSLNFKNDGKVYSVNNTPYGVIYRLGYWNCESDDSVSVKWSPDPEFENFVGPKPDLPFNSKFNFKKYGDSIFTTIGSTIYRSDIKSTTDLTPEIVALAKEKYDEIVKLSNKSKFGCSRERKTGRRGKEAKETNGRRLYSDSTSKRVFRYENHLGWRR